MPTTILYILLILLAFAVAYFSTPVAIKIAFKLGAIDKPDQRKVHQQTMPRLGGLAFFIAFIIATLVLSWDSSVFNGILLGGIIIFLVGMLDDVYQLSLGKLIGQCLAAVTAMYFGVIVHFVTNPFDGLLSLAI